MYVGGHKQHYATNSIAEAKRASLLLSREARMAVPVVGVIAFVDPGHITVKAVPGGGQYDPEIPGDRGDRIPRALRCTAATARVQR